MSERSTAPATPSPVEMAKAMVYRSDEMQYTVFILPFSGNGRSVHFNTWPDSDEHEQLRAILTAALTAQREAGAEQGVVRAEKAEKERDEALRLLESTNRELDCGGVSGCENLLRTCLKCKLDQVGAILQRTEKERDEAITERDDARRCKPDEYEMIVASERLAASLKLRAEKERDAMRGVLQDALTMLKGARKLNPPRTDILEATIADCESALAASGIEALGGGVV